MGPSGDSAVPSEAGAEWEQVGGVRSWALLASSGTVKGLMCGRQSPSAPADTQARGAMVACPQR